MIGAEILSYKIISITKKSRKIYQMNIYVRLKNFFVKGKGEKPEYKNKAKYAKKMLMKLNKCYILL